MNLAIAADDNYAQHAGITLTSILHHHDSPKELEVAVLSLGISSSNKSKLQLVSQKYGCKLNIYEIDDERIGNLAGRRYISNAMYCRLLLPQILPEQVKKVAYLDTDILVRANLRELWDAYTGQFPAAAVPDYAMGANWVQSLGFNSSKSYFNSGVMLINLEKWRAEGIGEQCISLLQNNTGRYKFPDQDALNLTLKGQWQSLPLKWNVTKGIFLQSWKRSKRRSLSPEQIEALTRPAIVHYSGAYKPWHYACGLPFAEEYMKFIPDSPWSEYRYPDKGPASWIKRYEYRLRERLAGAL